MNVGIIIYSQTGNTRSVAQRLLEKINTSGHTAKLEEITVSGDVHPGAKKFSFISRPDVTPYDAIVFGAQVMAFSLSPVMNAYLGQVSSLQGKKVALLVTEGLPYAWMGGTRAINRMRKLCASKGASICSACVVNWGNKKRPEMIADAVDTLGAAF